MIVRMMQKSDLPALRVLEEQCFLSPWHENQLLYELEENPYAFLLVADFDGQVIGMIDFWITFDQGCINQIAVLPSLERKGIGGVLLEDAVSRMTASGVSSITLEVRTQNSKAIHFYQSHGFNTVLVKEKYYDNGDDAYLMERRLDQNDENDLSD